jgi:hypothetical protein
MKSKICFFSVVTALSCSSVLAQTPTTTRPPMDSSRRRPTAFNAKQPVNGPRAYTEVITAKAKTTTAF